MHNNNTSILFSFGENINMAALTIIIIIIITKKQKINFTEQYHKLLAHPVCFFSFSLSPSLSLSFSVSLSLSFSVSLSYVTCHRCLQTHLLVHKTWSECLVSNSSNALFTNADKCPSRHRLCSGAQGTRIGDGSSHTHTS